MKQKQFSQGMKLLYGGYEKSFQGMKKIERCDKKFKGMKKNFKV